MTLTVNTFETLASGVQQLHSYRTADTLGVVVTSGYFNGLADRLHQFDIINLVNNVGGSTAMNILTVTSAEGAPNITVVSADAGGVVVFPPDAFAPAGWSVADPVTDGDITITVTTLPANNGSVITDIQYQLNGGSWVSVGAATTGTYNVSGLTNGVLLNVSLRAVNAGGVSPAAATKSVTPTAPIVYSAEAVAYFARMDVQESLARKGNIDTLIVTLKNAGLWDTADMIKLHLTTPVNSGLNMKSTSFTDALIATPTFTADEGYSCVSASSQGIDWGIAPSGGTQYQQDSACIYCWFNQTAGYAATPVGIASAAGTHLQPRSSGSNLPSGRINTNTTAAGATTISDAKGGFAVNRSSSTDLRFYRNGVLSEPAFTSTSAARSAVNINSMRSNSTFATGISPIFRWMGASLTAAQHLSLHQAVAAYRLTVTG